MNDGKKSDIPPFELHKNIFFVGSSKVSVHILKTEKGLIMIDSGFPDMFEQILDSMRCLGLDIRDVIAIFHSHGHIDHCGCTLRFKELSGAKTYISRIDNDIINGKHDLSWAKELNLEPLPFFNCDVLVEDGDCFQFGSFYIRCRLTPGHTDGVLSFFITFKSNFPIIAAMHGGVGLNSMTREFLTEYGLSFNCRCIFRNGLHTLANESVDLVLGNHPEQNDTPEKRKRVLNNQRATDPTEWKRFLKETEKKLDELINSEQNQNMHLR